MKKSLLLSICLVTAVWLQAQHCDSINDHKAGHYCLQTTDLIQLSDGNLLVKATQDSLTTHDINQQVIPYQTKYYKISRHGAIILDSITLDVDPWNGVCMMARRHRQGLQYDHIMIKFDITQKNMYLGFFNSDLVFDEASAVTVPLTDDTIKSFGWRLNRTCLLDSNDDIVLMYGRGDSTVFAKYSLDGTLKHETEYPRTEVPNSTSGIWIQTQGLKQCSEQPIKYNYFGIEESPNVVGSGCWGFELDSLFNIINSYSIYSYDPPFPYYANTINFNGMLSLDDGSACFVRSLWLQPNLWAPCLLKVDEDSQPIKKVIFQPSPVKYYGVSGIGMEKDDKGNIIYAFNGLDLDSNLYVAITKVDPDLNILWERYSLKLQEPFEFQRQYEGMRVLDNGGVAIFGINHHYNWDYNYPQPWLEPWLMGMFLAVFDEGTVNLPEPEGVLRPYLCYPNPVDNQLNIHYSPDVTPAKLELYDVNGRKIRTITQDLERIHTDDLPVGTYTLRITLEQGTVFPEKFIKK